LILIKVGIFNEEILYIHYLRYDELDEMHQKKEMLYVKKLIESKIFSKHHEILKCFKNLSILKMQV